MQESSSTGGLWTYQARSSGTSLLLGPSRHVPRPAATPTHQRSPPTSTRCLGSRYSASHDGTELPRPSPRLAPHSTSSRVLTLPPSSMACSACDIYTSIWRKLTPYSVVSAVLRQALSRHVTPTKNYPAPLPHGQRSGEHGLPPCHPSPPGAHRAASPRRRRPRAVARQLLATQRACGSRHSLPPDPCSDLDALGSAATGYVREPLRLLVKGRVLEIRLDLGVESPDLGILLCLLQIHVLLGHLALVLEHLEALLLIVLAPDACLLHLHLVHRVVLLHPIHQLLLLRRTVHELLHVLVALHVGGVAVDLNVLVARGDDCDRVEAVARGSHCVRLLVGLLLSLVLQDVLHLLRRAAPAAL
mmetsp:Transcript_48591/g.96917  ORF Transcript_48591/g.96917 Transcript_48591/m.96917 type:complete len:359 (+) Transcript_48591:126-1202(+)